MTVQFVHQTSLVILVVIINTACEPDVITARLRSKFFNYCYYVN